MAKKKSTTFTCTACGYKVSKWLGKCPDCSQWNSFEEEKGLEEAGHDQLRQCVAPSISDAVSNHLERVQTNISEFDRVVGGGIVGGSLILIGGEPGVGKSTLLLEVVGKIAAKTKKKILYVSGEESIEQVVNRAQRLKVVEKNIFVGNESNWEKIREKALMEKVSYLVVDSIQTTISPNVQSASGSAAQIREVTYEIMNFAKANGITCFVVGHITKDGAIAGPKILEHMVDTVIYFEGELSGKYRLLRAVKNRYGNTNEVGIFEMKEGGLKEVSNPSRCYLESSEEDRYGKTISSYMEGNRPLFVEIQALVVENKYGSGKRVTQGIEITRVSMLLAIIEKYLNIPIGDNDIYINAVGGVKIDERETDLSIIASILSSYRKKVITAEIVFIGEVGLTGEVRAVSNMASRLKEIEKMNVKKVITSVKVAEKYSTKYALNLIGIKEISQIEDAY